MDTVFAPDWASPPGETILDLSEERNWTQTELAQRLGYTQKHVSQLINGKVALSSDAASRLARVIGGTVEFWLSREAHYQSHKARLEAEKTHATYVPWLDELPVKELMKIGAILKKRIVAKNKPSIVEDCLRFFGCATPNDWHARYGAIGMAFRRGQNQQSNVGSICAWLRLGEQQAEKMSVPKYNKSRFEKALRTIRTLTGESSEFFIPEMQRLLSEAGVKFVVVPAIPKANVSGVSRWLNPTQPLIQLSLYGKTNDKFWFTFFHEAAHILLHSGSKEEKKIVFLNEPNAAYTNDSQESEANQCSSDWLIPSQHNKRLTELTNKEKVKDFAKQIEIHPGIVVGRLQHDAIIEPSWMNDLKAKV